MDSAPESLLYIGKMHTPFASAEDCPRHGDDSLSQGVVEVFAPFVPALGTLVVDQEITLITWLHRADRTVLVTWPRGDFSRPKRGVFNTRSPARPNPLGLHDVRILEIMPPEASGNVRLRVAHVDMINGTPLVDIKSSSSQRNLAPAEQPVSEAALFGNIRHREMEAVAAACRDAWQRGLFGGLSGNVSVRAGRCCLITRTGCAKSRLGPEDFSLLDIAEARPVAGAEPSSEAALHCAVYRAHNRIEAVAHTHPPHLLALEAVCPELFLARENAAYEREQFIARLARVPALSPGSPELAEAVAAVCRAAPAIWMQRHGLVCLGKNPTEALALAEEYDHLAQVELLSQRWKRPADV